MYKSDIESGCFLKTLLVLRNSTTILREETLQIKYFVQTY